MRYGHRSLVCVIGFLLAVGAIVLWPAPGFAQFGGIGGGGLGNTGGVGGNLGGGNLGGGNLGGGGNQVGGILIDAEGIVRSLESPTRSPKLQQAGRDAFLDKNLSDDVTALSERRYVSLVRLEAECNRLLQAGEDVDLALRYLAGLQRIDYLLVDLEGSDIVIAGPAEGFVPDVSGRMVGVTTGRPPLRLDDLIVALLAADAGLQAIGCSIDPEPQRLAQMQRFVQQNSGPTSPAGAARRYQRMAEILGQQNISLFGVAEDSHFAVTLIEADFRMKRISLGVDPSGVRGLRSHLSLLKPNGNSIQRWWFTPFYEALSATDDRTVFHLSGQRVQLMAQEEISTAAGDRSDAAFTRASAREFAKMFTQAYPELAARHPLFAELQNLFDLAIVAALLQKQRLPEQVGWEPTLFLERNPELVPVYAVPRHVPSMSTFRRASQGLILGLVGGVTINPRQVLQQMDARGDAAQQLSTLQRAAATTKPQNDARAWWWD